MAVALDSSVFVEAERRGLDLPAIVNMMDVGERLAVPAVVISELLLGLHLGQPASRQADRAAFIERIIRELQILDFDLSVARVYSQVWARLRRAGALIPAHDLMIGATALANGFAVLTHNLRHFERIPDLEVRQPTWQ